MVLEYAYLNSYYQTGLKNLLDLAVLAHAAHHELLAATAFRMVDELPFDFARRRMSVVVAEPADSTCSSAKARWRRSWRSAREFVTARRRAAHAGTARPSPSGGGFANEDGLRVVAVAAKELPPLKRIRLADEADLTLMGYIAFLDPPKETTAPALRALAEHGVALKLLTGDNELVTAKICRDVGVAAGRHPARVGRRADGRP